VFLKNFVNIFYGFINYNVPDKFDNAIIHIRRTFGKNKISKILKIEQKGVDSMGIISWIIVGALAGWLGSILAGKNSEMGGFANVVVGILGAFIGGLIMRLFGIDGITGFNIWSIIVATLGAFLLLFIVKSKRRNNGKIKKGLCFVKKFIPVSIPDAT
jgi:uncharacterized membrane protein YeaQ/YmgE (transglycosylase-associated protein family)